MFDIVHWIVRRLKQALTFSFRMEGIVVVRHRSSWDEIVLVICTLDGVQMCLVHSGVVASMFSL